MTDYGCFISVNIGLFHKCSIGRIGMFHMIDQGVNFDRCAINAFSLLLLFSNHTSTFCKFVGYSWDDMYNWEGMPTIILAFWVNKKFLLVVSLCPDWIFTSMFSYPMCGCTYYICVASICVGVCNIYYQNLYFLL